MYYKINILKISDIPVHFAGFYSCVFIFKTKTIFFKFYESFSVCVLFQYIY